jgi:FOG: EAL domain
MIAGYRRERLHLVIDDFGDGHSGLRRLYEYLPDHVKLDRFLIQGIDTDRRNARSSPMRSSWRISSTSSHRPGIETEGELVTCREIGCDLAQGYLIAPPKID